jgi:hypothetical protein
MRVRIKERRRGGKGGAFVSKSARKQNNRAVTLMMLIATSCLRAKRFLRGNLRMLPMHNSKNES